MKIKIKTSAIGVCLVGLSLVNSHAQTVLGSFQGASDPLNAGWVDPNDAGAAITTSPNASFVAGGVPGYALSLDMSAAGQAGNFGYPSLELQFSSSQVAAFNANSWITFTMSVPTGASTAGYFQLYNLVLNAPGYGYNNFLNGNNAAATWGTYAQATGSTGNNQNGMPNFYFYSDAPSLFSETVTVNYSSVLSAIEAGGESYLQMTLQGNQGGGAPTDLFINNVVLSTGAFGVDPVPEPASLALLGLGGLISLSAMRRKH